MEDIVSISRGRHFKKLAKTFIIQYFLLNILLSPPVNRYNLTICTYQYLHPIMKAGRQISDFSNVIAADCLGEEQY